MDRTIAEQEKTLERLEIAEQVEEKRLSIKQKKHLAKQLRSEEGIGWKKVMGIVGKLKMDKEQAQTLFSQNRDLRELSIPRMKRMR